MKIFDWMHRRVKHDMSYYSKVPQGKGGMKIDIPGTELESRSTDHYISRKSAEALLLVELSNEVPAAAAAIYHVLGLEGMLTIGTLGSSPPHYGRLGKEVMIPKEEDEEEEQEEQEEQEENELVEHETARRCDFQEGKAKKSVVLPRETPVLETLQEIPQLEVAAADRTDEEMYLVKPLLAKAEEHDVEDLVKGRITLRDLFLMSDDEFGDNHQYSDHNETRAIIQNDSSHKGKKDGHYAVWDKIKNTGSSGTADAELPADCNKGHLCSGKVINVLPTRKKERDGASSKFRRLIRRMTRTKIHPDVDLRRSGAQTCVLPGKDVHKEGLQNHGSNKSNFKCAALFH